MNPHTRPTTVDPAALHAWNADVNRAKRAYYGRDTAADAYATRIAASEKSMRYQRRKAARDAA